MPQFPPSAQQAIRASEDVCQPSHKTLACDARIATSTITEATGRITRTNLGLCEIAPESSTDSGRDVHYSAQHESFAGFLSREIATTFNASDIVGNTWSRSIKPEMVARYRMAIAAS